MNDLILVLAISITAIFISFLLIWLLNREEVVYIPDNVFICPLCNIVGNEYLVGEQGFGRCTDCDFAWSTPV